MTPTAPARAREPRRVPVDGVTAVVLIRREHGALGEVLDALAAQSYRLDRVLLVGLPSNTPAADEVAHHPLARREDLQLTSYPDRPGPGWLSVPDGIQLVGPDLPTERGSWIWLLHEDTVPRPGALAALIGAARQSSRVAVVGPKILDADEPGRLRSVGQHVSRTGKVLDGGIAGQVDQGQFDQRTDVLGVPVAGMLARADVLTDLGGFDPAFQDGTEGLDLSWRAHLTGRRVVLAPAAVVVQGQVGMGVVSQARTRRRTRQLALSRGSVWAAPWRALLVLVGSVLAALGLVLVKRPRESAAALGDAGAAITPVRGAGARWRFRGRRTVRERDLQGLFEPQVGAGLHTATLGRSGPGRRTPAPGTTGPGGTETGPVSDEFAVLGEDTSRARLPWSWPVLVTLALAGAAAAVHWRGLWGAVTGSGVGVTGPELAPSGTDSSGLIHLWWHGWHGADAMLTDVSAAWVLPMAGLSRALELVRPGDDAAADLATAWLLLLAVPVAALVAYLAGRVATHRRWPRVLAALGWAGLAPLTVAVDQARLGPAVVHVLAPALVAGMVLALGRAGVARTRVTFATILGVALASWFVPVVLLWSTLAGLLGLLLARGSRWRALALAVLPPVFLAPSFVAGRSDPRLLLGGPGATTTVGPSAEWPLLLLHPGGTLSITVWWTLPLLALAVAAPAMPGLRGRRAAAAVAIGVLAMVMALAAPLVRVGTVPAGYGDAGQPITSWPGTLLSLAGAGVLLAALQVVDPLRSRTRRPGRLRRLLAASGAATAIVAAVAGLALLGWHAQQRATTTLSAAGQPLPAVAAEQASGPEALRTLELTPMAEVQVAGERIDYRVLGAAPHAWSRDRVQELVRPATGDPGVTTAVQDLVATDALTPGASPPLLSDLAVGYVLLRADAEHPLAAGLDTVPGLTRLSAVGGDSADTVWRVTGAEEATGPAARVRVETPDGARAPVPSGDDATVRSTTVSAGDEGADLVVADGQPWAERAVVRVDGEVVAPQGALPVRYPLPDGEHEVQVVPGAELAADTGPWWIGVAVLGAGCAFLALPLGGRRAERER